MDEAQQDLEEECRRYDDLGSRLRHEEAAAAAKEVRYYDAEVKRAVEKRASTAAQTRKTMAALAKKISEGPWYYNFLKNIKSAQDESMEDPRGALSLLTYAADLPRPGSVCAAAAAPVGAAGALTAAEEKERQWRAAFRVALPDPHAAGGAGDGTRCVGVCPDWRPPRRHGGHRLRKRKRKTKRRKRRRRKTTKRRKRRRKRSRKTRRRRKSRKKKIICLKKFILFPNFEMK